MLDKNKALERLHSMKPNDVADIINKSLLDAGIEPCNDVNGVVGFSLTDNKKTIKKDFLMRLNTYVKENCLMVFKKN